MLTALGQLGVEIAKISQIDFLLKGCGGVLGKESGQKLYVGNSGTASRFLISALMLLKEGIEIEMIGDKRIEERPM